MQLVGQQVIQVLVRHPPATPAGTIQPVQYGAAFAEAATMHADRRDVPPPNPFRGQAVFQGLRGDVEAQPAGETRRVDFEIQSQRSVDQ